MPRLEYEPYQWNAEHADRLGSHRIYLGMNGDGGLFWREVTLSNGESPLFKCKCDHL